MSGRRVTIVYPHTDRARVRIEAPCEWINANHRYAHWAVKAKRTSAWRQAADPQYVVTQRCAECAEREGRA